MKLNEIHDIQDEPMQAVLIRKHLKKELKVSYATRWPPHAPDDLTRLLAIDEPSFDKGINDGTEVIYGCVMANPIDFDSEGYAVKKFHYTFSARELSHMDIHFMPDDPTHLVFTTPSR